MFDLLTPTHATLKSLTLRREMHGDDKIPAVTLGLAIEGSNLLLMKFGGELLVSLYTHPETPDAQAPLPGVDGATPLPLLKVPSVEVLSLSDELIGAAVTIDYGIDDNAIQLADCKVSKFRIHPKQGGTVLIELKASTSKVTEYDIGRLSQLLDGDVMLTVEPPAAKQQVIDGSVMAFESSYDRSDERDATDLFVDAHDER